MNTVDKIINLLETQGKEQKDLANYLGVSKNRITDWKAGRVKSYSKYLPQIANYLGVTVDYLVSPLQQASPTCIVNQEPSSTLSPLGTITPDEISLVLAWRSHPEYHDALRKILDMPMPEAKKDTTA